MTTAKHQGPCDRCGRTEPLPEWLTVKRGGKDAVVCSDHCARDGKPIKAKAEKPVAAHAKK